MSSNRSWKPEEIHYLEDNWGIATIKSIAKKLGRTENAILIKSKKIGLGSVYNAADYLNAKNVANILGIDHHAITDYWIPKCGLKGKKKALRKASFWRIKLNDLIKWLEANQDKWDSRRVELYALSKEPDWLKEKRKRDMSLPEKQYQKWTKEQDQLLIHYYKLGKKQKEISELMGRSESGIQRRISRLKEIGKLDKRKIDIRWTDKENKLFLQLEAEELSDKEIAYELGREEKHISDHRRILRQRGEYQGYKRDNCSVV